MMTVWLDIDEPNRKLTLHTGDCRHVWKAGRAQYKPIADRIDGEGRDGRWVRFDSLDAAQAAAEARFRYWVNKGRDMRTAGGVVRCRLCG